MKMYSYVGLIFVHKLWFNFEKKNYNQYLLLQGNFEIASIQEHII